MKDATTIGLQPRDATTDVSYINENHQRNPRKSCRYYDGEKDNPYKIGDARGFLWDYERRFVEMERSGDVAILDAINEYKANGLAEYRVTDGVSIGLKAILFNRYTHWNGIDIGGFKTWYESNY